MLARVIAAKKNISYRLIRAHAYIRTEAQKVRCQDAIIKL